MSFSILASAADGAGTPAWAMLAYLIAGVCFILALRGLSHPESSRQGNLFGMIGMAIAVVTTLFAAPPAAAAACESPHQDLAGDARCGEAKGIPRCDEALPLP